MEVLEVQAIPDEEDDMTGKMWIRPDLETMAKKPFLDINDEWRRFWYADGRDLVLVNMGHRGEGPVPEGGAYWAEGFLGWVPPHAAPPGGRIKGEEWWVVEGELNRGPFVNEEGKAHGE